MSQRIPFLSSKPVIPLFAFCLITGTASAGTYSGGSGTEGDPYRIATTDDLIELSTTPGDWGGDVYFVQTANIAFDADETQVDWDGDGTLEQGAGADDTFGFSPVGNSSTKFSGHFNGNGYTIQNLYINRPSDYYIGLFGYTDAATVRRTGLTEADVSGSYYVGGLIGRSQNGTVCQQSFCIGSVSGDYAGGLIGRCYDTRIENSYSRGQVTGDYSSTGGLVGNLGYDSTVSNCYSTAIVIAEDDRYKGGLVASNSGVVTASYWDIQTSGTESGEGGVGKITSEMTSAGTFLAGGWDFADETNNGDAGIWSIHEADNDGYPTLTWQGNGNDLPFFRPSLDGVSHVAQTTAQAGGTVHEVISGGTVNARGVCWNTSGYPEVTDSKTTDGTGTGAFSSAITGLSAATTYYLRAYVTDTEGTSYSAQISFTTPPFAGAGTETNPYAIATLDDLRFLSQQTDFWDKHFVQTADIDASATRYWDDSDDNGDGDPYNDSNDSNSSGDNEGFSPIGYYDTSSPLPFSGTYDGQDFTIDGLSIDRRLDQGNNGPGGLFGYAENATFANLGLTSADIYAEGNAGALVAYSQDTSISNCYATGTIICEVLNGVGGLIGRNRSSEVTACYANATVKGVSRDGSTYYDIGGLIGNNQESIISNCYTEGEVKGKEYYYPDPDAWHSETLGIGDVGGLIGSDQDSVIANSYSHAAVSTADDDIGGLIGISSGSSVFHCHSTGAVTGWYDEYNDAADSIGGFIGRCTSGTIISDCYASGDVTAFGQSVGGFVGSTRYTIIENSYSLGKVTGYNPPSGATAEDYGGFVGRVTGNGDGLGNIHNCYARGDVDVSSSVTRYGGFGGWNYRADIRNCYATGSVEPATDPLNKGFLGENYQGNNANNFFDATLSGHSSSVGAAAKTTAELTSLTTFTDVAATAGLDSPWDFTGTPNDDAANNDYWNLDAATNGGYPVNADHDPHADVVTGTAHFSETTMSTTFFGTVLYVGKHVPTSFGVVVNTSGNPTTADTLLTPEETAIRLGEYEVSDALVPDTTYSYRAFVAKETETVYGEEKSFHTPIVNEAPIFDQGESAALAIHEDSGANAINSLLLVTDDDTGDTLTWSAASAPAHGALAGFDATTESNGGSVAPAGLTYTPDADFSGSDAFDVQISDGTDSDTMTVNVTVNDAPGVVSINRGTSPGTELTNAGSVEFDVTFSEAVDGVQVADFATYTDGDVSGDIAITAGADGDMTYTVTVSNLTGDGTLRLDLTDDDGITGADTATPLGGVGTTDAGDGSRTGDQSYTIDTTGPIANDDTTAEAGEDDGSALLTNVNSSGDNLTDNDTGAANVDPVVAVNGIAAEVGSAVAGDNGGLFTVNGDGSVRFDPNNEFATLAAGESETTSVTVTVRDSVSNTSTSTLSVTIQGSNDAPVLGNLGGDAVSLVLNAYPPVAIDAGGDATVADADDGDFNGGYLVIADAGGTVGNNGTFSLDGATATSGGDAALAAGETVSVGGSAIGTVDATDDGQSGNDLRIDFTTTDATPAAVQTLIRNIRYTAAATPGERSFSVRVNDGSADSDPATVTVAAAASCRLYETFDSNIPGDWSQVRHSGTGNWEWTDSPGSWANVPNSDDKVAIAESYGDWYNSYDVSLFTPSLDMTGRTSVRIDVDKFFEEYEYRGSQEARIAVYSGGRSSGNREVILGTWTNDDPWDGEHVTYTIDPSGYDDPSHVYIEFWYTTNGSTYCRGFAIDNVIIDGREPTVTTDPANAVTEFTATAHGTIADLGFPDQAAAHGFCWNTTGSPTTEDEHTDLGAIAATGAFSADLDTLTPNTTYYVRAYATTPLGTFYSDAVSFTTAGEFGGGSGTEADPYQIASLEDLRILAEHPAVWGSHFVQTADIDASQTQYWDDSDDNGDGILYNDTNDATADGTNDGFSPIGNVTTKFTGNYDGNGHIIDALTIHRGDTDYIGFLGIVDPGTSVSDLGLTQVNIIGGNSTGGLAGSSYQADIARCFSTGSVIGGEKVGGLIGYIGYNTSVDTCWSRVSVEGEDLAGGFAGSAYRYVEATNCYSAGAVTGTGTVGGFLAEIDSSATADACFWDTEITGMTTSAAGTGRTTAAMLAPLTYLYAGWDFADETANGSDGRWTLHPDDNGGYPALAWQGLRNDIPWFGVTTDAVTDISAATANADNTVIEYASGGTISARGVCWNTTGSPTIADAKTTDATVTGTLTATVTGLGPDTTYYLRAYVTNDEDTTHYGAEITFTTPPFTGSGTAGDPFRFEDLEDLRFLAQNNGYWDKHIELQNDLDLSQTQYWDDSDDNGDGDAYNDANDATADGSNDGWLPVASAGTPFTGTFDGQGFSLAGLAINRDDTNDVGLFAYTGDGATIRDLALIEVDITGGNHVGALAGTNGGEVQRCETTGEVTGTDDVGGLVGINAATGTLDAAYSAADVYGAHRIGGLLGTQSDSTTTNSYSTGSVRGYDVLGGLIGHNNGGTVSTSYSAGTVNQLGPGADSTGGLVAVNDGGTISNCFWDTKTSGLDSSAGGTGKTSVELRDQALFTGAGWDLTSIWQISDGVTRPLLAFQDVSVQNGYPVKVGGDYKTRRFSNGVIRNNSGEGITFTEYGVLYHRNTPPVWGESDKEVAGTDTAVAAGADLPIPDTTLADLPLGSTWYARTYATDGTHVWYGDVVRITVPAPTVLLQTPRTQHSTTNTTPDFTWSGSATGTANYTLYVGTTPDVYASGTAYDLGDAQSVSLPDALTPGATYYWGIELTDDVDSVQSAVQPLGVLNENQGGDIVSGIDNANPVGDSVGGPGDVRLADLDGDGDLDVVAASRSDNAIFWYANTNSAGTFGSAQTITTDAAGATRVQIGDIDNDGDLDVASASAGDDTIAWYANDGSGDFGGQQIITTNAAGAQDLVLSDLDGDGDLDVVTASFYDDTIAWHENQGAGSFSERKVVSSGSLSGPVAVNAADLNGDGAPDIVAFSKMDGRLVWYPNSGAGGFGAEQAVDAVRHNLTGNIEAADLDGDGDLDLVVNRKSTVLWYENTDGSGSFSAAETVYQNPTGYDFGFGDMAVAADLDGDGDLDVLSSGPGGHPSGVKWHRNDGTGNFDRSRDVVYYGAIGSRTPVRAGDIDGDGDLDVVAASRLNRRIDWFENRHGAAPFVVDGVPDQTANAGIAYTYAIGAEAFDDLDDGDTLTYSAALVDGTPLPGWLSFDPATATFSGTPTVADIAALEIEVTAEDSTGATGSDTFALAVIDAAGAPATQVTHSGDSGAGSLRQVIADAAAGDTITFAPELDGNTITFTSSEIDAGAPAIQIDKSLTLDGDLDDDGTPDITLSGNGAYAHFLMDDGDTSYADIVLDGLVLTDGWVDRRFDNTYGPVTTHENLELRNCVIKDSSGPALGFALWAEDGETVLHGCEVKNNVNRLTRLPQGGPLYFRGARAEVVDCDIHGNSGYFVHGGGIAAFCDLTVRNTSVRNNIGVFGDQKYLNVAMEGSGGGGINFRDMDSSLVIEDSTISGNMVAAGTGGGVLVTRAADVTIRDSRITHNYALGSGGLRVGVQGGVGDLTLERSVISGNTCGSIIAFKWGGGHRDYFGAGLWLDNVTSATIDACTISDNMTPEYIGVEEAPTDPKYYNPDITGYEGGGSGIYADGGTLTLRNSTISGNTTYAGLGGVHRADTGDYPVYNIAAPTPGGLYMESGDADIQNCTFAGNAGGGVIVKSGTTAIESSIFSGNVQSDVGDAYPVDLVNSGGTLITSNSLVEAATGGHGLTDGVDGNIVGTDPLLGPLADNGGPTQTRALLPGSPAIDAGSNPADAAADQRGADYPRVRYEAADMGAFEVQLIPEMPAIEDQQAMEASAFSFVVPEGGFGYQGVTEELTYAAALDDGSALPAWLSFDPATRTFSGTPGESDVGTVSIAVTATDVRGATATTVFDLTAVTDATAPTVTVDAQVTADSTPALSGTVDDPNAAISVTVDGRTYSAANHGATWTLADGTLSPLAPGIYDVSVTATDAADNSGSDATTDELEIVTDWEDWRRVNFTTAQLADPAISGPEANPDGDARDNIFEFLYLSDPMAFDGQDPVHSELNGSDLTEWSFVRRIERSGTTLTVRVSDNPDLSGATVLNNPETTPIDAESETATYIDDTAVRPDAPRYFRIEITVE